LSRKGERGKALNMSEKSMIDTETHRCTGAGRRSAATKPATQREERLAEKLRENLRRRKSQNRQMRDSHESGLPKSSPDS